MKVKDFERIVKPNISVRLYRMDATFAYNGEYEAGVLDICAYSDCEVDFYHFGTDGLALWLKEGDA